MHRSNWLLASLMALSPLAQADVRELDGKEMVDSFVEGISIGQPVTDTQFATDDEAIRETVTDQKNQLGEVGPAIAVRNAEVLNRDPSLTELVNDVSDQGTRDLIEDAITQTALGPRLDINLDRIAAETGITPGTPNRDFDTMRGALLELLPITTGYQFEFGERY